MKKETSFDSEEENSGNEELQNNQKIEHQKRKEEITETIPNLDILKSITKTIISVLEDNKKLGNYKEIIISQSKMEFSSKNIPSISIESYLIRIQKYGKMEGNTLISSLIYIDRLCNMSKIKLTYYNIHRILFIAILLSIKYNEDNYFQYKYYALIAGVKEKELKFLEYIFIALLDFRLFVNNDIFEKYNKYVLNLPSEED